MALVPHFSCTVAAQDRMGIRRNPRMRLATGIVKWAVSGCLACGLAAAAPEARSVLALGDSITAGGKGFPSYRQFLKPDLEKRGLHFIGPVKDAVSAHAGFGGRNSTFLRARIQEIYKAHPADVVLIHSGHNHDAADHPVPVIVEDTEAMVAVIREINPQVVILIAQVIPSGKLPKYAYLPELNQKLATLVERLRGQGAPVWLVNQADGFDWKTDTNVHIVHPNEAGARKMAQQWLKVLLVALEK